MCNVYLDGELWKKDVSQYPPKVDFPGMSRGYEKRYRQILAEVHGLEEKKTYTSHRGHSERKNEERRIHTLQLIMQYWKEAVIQVDSK